MYTPMYTSNVDETVLEGPHPEGCSVHKLICESGGIIAENLAGIDAVDFDDPILSLFPSNSLARTALRCGRRLYSRPSVETRACVSWALVFR